MVACRSGFVLILLLGLLPCLPTQSTIEKEVILDLAQSISPLPSGWSLTNATYCCDWPGITCDIQNQYIAQIDLKNFSLVGSIPDSIGNLTQLTYLRMSDNKLSGTIPRSIGKLANLQELRMANNQFSGPIPETIGSASHLTTLYLPNNQLNGTIPPSIGSLASLQLLWLHNNSLSGTIPPEIGNLNGLTYLYLHLNRLVGTIPPSIGSLTNLIYFQLNNNNLTGSIPEGIGNLVNLTNLWLNENMLNGTIPASLGNLSNLIYLGLDSNQLSGTIPPQLSNLSNLTTLLLANNRLVGCYTDTVVASTCRLDANFLCCIPTQCIATNNICVPYSIDEPLSVPQSAGAPISNIIPSEQVPDTPSSIELSVIIPAVIIPVVVVIAVAVFLGIYLRKKRRPDRTTIVNPVPEGAPIIEVKQLNPENLQLFNDGLLGSGAHARVRKGQYKDGDKIIPVAVKIRNKAAGTHDLEREARIMAYLQHDNITKMLGVCEKGGDLHLVMELASGSLHDFIHREDEGTSYGSKDVELTELTQNKIWRIAHDVAEGLRYLHTEAQIVHRDVKPANILLFDNYQKAKLCDFGFAGSLTNSLQTYGGTPSFKAPEVNGITEYDEKVDVYSYGLVIFEMLTGDHPPNGSAPDLKQIAPHWSGLLARCWQKSSDRPSMTDVLEYLHEIEENCSGGSLLQSPK